jgi:hypothetical protein
MIGRLRKMHNIHWGASLPGEEAQVDFGLGAPVAVDGKRCRTWVFRM